MDLRHLTDEDVPEAGRVFVTSLGDPPPKEPERFRRYWDVGTSLGAWDGDGRLVGVAARFPSQLTAVGGADLQCSAVPSVGVRPDHHGQGVGRALLERQVLEARDRGDLTLALNASEVGIYGRYGYGPTSTWWSVRSDPRQVTWRADAPRAAPGSIQELTPAEASEHLPALYERVRGNWAGEVARHAGWWSINLHPRKDMRPPLFAIHRDEDGEVDAAIRFAVTQAFDDTGFANKVELTDAFGRTPAAEAVLLRWLFERRLVGQFRTDRLDPRTPLPWMAEDPRRLCTTATADAVWVRVVDVPAVVAARTTLGRGAVAVRVHDPLLPENDRTWLFAGDGAKLTCEPTDAAPQVEVGVDLLASLLWAFVDPARLAGANRIEVHDAAAVEELACLLATAEPSWCSTGF